MWLLSGIIPNMIYYGLKILHPSVFLLACLIICSIISITTGSSWTTSATVGIALVGIGNTLGISIGIVGGAVISEAYFGDKLSPLSDTTNLAPANRYRSIYTYPLYVLPNYSYLYNYTFTICLGILYNPTGDIDITAILVAISDTFNISP